MSLAQCLFMVLLAVLAENSAASRNLSNLRFRRTLTQDPEVIRLTSKACNPQIQQCGGPAPTTDPTPTPTPDPTSITAPTPAPSQQTSGAVAQSVPDTCVDEIYVIKAGDTLLNIAQIFGMDMQDILDANPGLQADFISVGQSITIPTCQKLELQQQESQQNNVLRCGSQYKLQSGDTLHLISQKVGTTLQAILDANPDMPDPNMLPLGFLINIPTC